MATKVAYKTTFEVDQVIRPIFTGGSVALDKDAHILTTTLGDDALLTDLATGKLFATIEGDGEPISALTITPSASHLILCSRSLSMRIYALRLSDEGDTIETTLLRTLKPHATPAVVVAVDRTGTLLATGAADGNVKVWDIRGGFVTHTFRGPSVLVSALHFFEVRGTAAFKPAKKNKSKKAGGQANGAVVMAAETANAARLFRLAAGSQDGKVRVWDLHRRAIVASLEAHVSDVQAIDYSAAQDTLVTAGRDKTIAWWDAATWTTRRVVPTFELVEAAGFLRGSGRGGADVREGVEDGADEKKQEGAEDGAVTYTAGSNGCVRLWDSRTGRELTTEQPARSEEDEIVAALYRPGGVAGQPATLLCVQMDHTLALYPVPLPDALVAAATGSGRVPALEPSRRISGTHDEVIDLAFLLPDQSLLALATNSEDVRIVSVGAADGVSTYFGQDVALLKGHEDLVITLDVDWSGHWIATGAKDNSARLWRVDGVDGSGNKTFASYAVFAGHAESVGAVALPKTVPPGDSAAFRDPLNHPPAFLVTGSQDLTIKRWDIPRQAPAAGAATAQRAHFTRKAHDKDINALAIDAAGQLFASSSQDRTVKIWSVREGEVQGILRGHRRGVWSVAFAPPHTAPVAGEDGSTAVAGGGRRGLVLTGSGDKTVKLWSLADYSCLRTFEGHTNSVLKVVWLSSGREAAAAAGKKNGSDEEGDMDVDDAEEEGSDDDVSSGRRGGLPTPVLFASAGADGLVKVWDATTNEAACTLDNHEDRVWALAVSRPDARRKAAKARPVLVSGAADATVTFWRDTSAATVAAASAAARVRVEKEQQLANHMQQGAFRDAVTLALQLNQPGRLLAVLSQVGLGGEEDEGGAAQRRGVDAVLGDLSDDQLYTLLLRVRDWNTNGRTAPVAQRVLATLVRSYPAARLAGLARLRRSPKSMTAAAAETAVAATRPGRGTNMKEVLDALQAYTERHYRRMADLLDESYLVEYTLQEMDALQAPGGAVVEIEDVAMAGAD